MARIPAVVIFGDSLVAGTGFLSELSTTSFYRWAGQTLPTTYPVDITVDDMQVLTARMPYANSTDYSIGTLGTPSTTKIKLTGYTYDAADIGKAIYIASNTTAYGQTRFIIGPGVDASDATVNVAWSPAMTEGAGTATLVEDCFAISAIAAYGTTTQFSKASGVGVDFTSSDVGKWIVAMSGTPATLIGVARRILAVVDADNVVVDRVWNTGVQVGDHLCVMRGADGAHSFAGLTTSTTAVRSLRFFYDRAYCYTDPYDYPNQYSSPLSMPYTHGIIQAGNALPELLWKMRAHYDMPVHAVHLGVGGSMLTAFPVGDAGRLFGYSWSGDVTQNDWCPGGSGGLYRVLTKYIELLAQHLAPNTLDVQLVCVNLGTNDSPHEARASQFYSSMVTLRDALRTYIADSGYSSLGRAQIPWLVTKIGPSALLTYRASINADIDTMAQDDDFTGAVDITDVTIGTDTIHYTPTGEVTWANNLYDKWREIVDAQVDSAPLVDDRVTLLDIRDKVRRRYERTSQSNDARPAQIDGFINDALREFYSTVGDVPWFLEHRYEIPTWSYYPSLVELPRYIRRPLRFEVSSAPGRDLPWRAFGSTDKGQIKIGIFGSFSGSLTCVHAAVPKDLQNDGDVCVIPADYVELIVILACKRLAEASGNATVASYYNAESDRVWAYVRRSLQAHRRAEKAQMTAHDEYDGFGGGSSTPILWGL